MLLALMINYTYLVLTDATIMCTKEPETKDKC